jgi:hypothetical protein
VLKLYLLFYFLRSRSNTLTENTTD